MRSSVRFRWSPALALCLVLIGTSCLSTTYEIEMAPADLGLERTLYAEFDSTKDWPRPGSKVGDRLERVYGVRPDSTPYEATGRFADIPEDLGNWGIYRAYRSPLGSSMVYLERFGGDAHPSATVTNALEAADSLYGLLHLWFEAELGRHTRWPAASAYLDRELRPLLRDFAIGAYLKLESDHLMTAVASIIEHPELLVLLVMASDEEEEEAMPPVFSDAAGYYRFRTELAAALEFRTPAEAEAALAFLSDHKHAKASMTRAIAAARNIEPEEAFELWSDAVSDAQDQGWGASDSLIVRFASEAEPKDTNGAWDASSREVVWRAGYSGPEPKFKQAPIVCFAEWALPDSVLQQRLFGRVVLEGNDLETYSWRYSELDSAQKVEWDRLLLSLEPGKLKSLERFRFADERKRKVKVDDSRARPLADLVLQGARADSTVAGK